MSTVVTENEYLGFLDVAYARRDDCFEQVKNVKKPVKTFGVVNNDGKSIEMTFVVSSLAPKGQDKLDPKPDTWCEYQLASMFASWYPKPKDAS